MLIKIFFLLATFVYVECQTCMDEEICQQNIILAGENYSKNLNKIYLEVESVERQATENFQKEFNKLKAEISKGPEECKGHQLTKSSTAYQDELSRDCRVDFSGRNKEAEEKINSFPENYMEVNTAEERIYYCKYLVPGFNYYCDQMRERLEASKNCGLVEKFDEQYRKPWEKCVNSIN